jgi:hypothetical protein
MGVIVVGNIVAVVQESVGKVATWANHGGGEGEMHVRLGGTSIWSCDIARGSAPVACYNLVVQEDEVMLMWHIARHVRGTVQEHPWVGWANVEWAV